MLVSTPSIYSIVFTSHYVTINSVTAAFPSAANTVFTSHYVTINSEQARATVQNIQNLHPTM